MKRNWLDCLRTPQATTNFNFKCFLQMVFDLSIVIFSQAWRFWFWSMIWVYWNSRFDAILSVASLCKIYSIFFFEKKEEVLCHVIVATWKKVVLYFIFRYTFYTAIFWEIVLSYKCLRATRYDYSDAWKMCFYCVCILALWVH